MSEAIPYFVLFVRIGQVLESQEKYILIIGDGIEFDSAFSRDGIYCHLSDFASDDANVSVFAGDVAVMADDDDDVVSVIARDVHNGYANPVDDDVSIIVGKVMIT